MGEDISFWDHSSVPDLRMSVVSALILLGLRQAGHLAFIFPILLNFRSFNSHSLINHCLPEVNTSRGIRQNLNRTAYFELFDEHILSAVHFQYSTFHEAQLGHQAQIHIIYGIV